MADQMEFNLKTSHDVPESLTTVQTVGAFSLVREENGCWLGHQSWCFPKKDFELYPNRIGSNSKILSME